MRLRGIVLAGTLVASLIGAAVGPSPVVNAASVPAGFTDQLVANFDGPTTVEWLPGDRIVVLEQGGRVKVGGPDGSFTTALTLNAICTNSERGLLGFTHDSAFLTNSWVYVYYTHSVGGGCVNRVSRFTMVDDTIDPASEVVVIDNISSINGNHNGGDLDIGSDGYLYVAIGDAGSDPRGDSGSAGGNDAAQDLSLLNGKILRLMTDGRPAPGNPFSGPGTVACGSRGNTVSTPSTTCQEIYSWGLRNPYRIAFDRNDGADRFFINDVGQRTYEEVSEGAAGNFGWPQREGQCPQGDTLPCAGPQPGQIDPLFVYGRNDGSYITGGVFIPNGMWPQQYDGSYFFADGGSGNIWRANALSDVDIASPWATGASGLTDMVFGYDEDGQLVMYYVRLGGELRKITQSNPAAPPSVDDQRMIPIDPIRVYDTGTAIGTTTGDVFNGTTRMVDLDPPGPYRAALVNITLANVDGSGYARTWASSAPRPAISSVNVQGAGSTVGNAAIVPLDADGRFMLEAAATGRVVIDVMAWFAPTAGTSTDGRFIAFDPARAVDTRRPSGSTLDSGSPNPWTRTGNRIDMELNGIVGLPAPDTIQAVVVSVAAIGRPNVRGHVTVVGGGDPDSGTASVSVGANDLRNNLVVAPLTSSGISVYTVNVDDIVVDVLGYVTSSSAPSSGTGLFTAIDADRVVDTRVGAGFGRLGPRNTATLVNPVGTGASAIVQTITVVQTSAAGWIVAHPNATVPVVSNLNYRAPGQTRGTLAFTSLADDGSERFTSLVATDVVVDAVGYFSR